MGRMLAVVLPLALLVGCASSEVKSWSVDPLPSSGSETVRAMEGEGRLFGTTRLGSIVVSAPCDRTQFVVRRADGTSPHDPWNVFSATPASLLRAPAESALDADGRLGRIVGQASIASTDALVEVRVKDLSLDCREAQRQLACASVTVDVVNTGRGPRTIAYSGTGTAAVEAEDRNYSRAFSQAFSQAFGAAVNDALPPRRR